MTFKKLRREISGRGPVPIVWNKSGIVELAEVTNSGGISITNVITKKSYRIPPHYKNLDLTVLDRNQLVTLGSLLPKEMR